jgi:beta-ribofuranosylaminobenzene 5'-phosphate synthase
MPLLHTPSRLHFGLISLPNEDAAWLDHQGQPSLPSRRFGGAGLMIESPGLVLRAESGASWSAAGPLAERALSFAHDFRQSLETDGILLTPQRLVVESAPREHVGLGTGTQLALAVAKLLAEVAGLSFSAEELARRVKRGLRSGLGVHGFSRGGFLVDGGKRSGTALAPLVARMEFPADWRILVVVPEQLTGLHGSGEQAAFARLAAPPGTTEILCRLVLLGMLPALAERDLEAFGAALFDFNARVGEVFAPEQSGTWAHPFVEGCIEFLRGLGVRGVGQSSWGPTVFAVSDEERASWLAGRLGAFLPLGAARVVVSRGADRGAWVEKEDAPGLAT